MLLYSSSTDVPQAMFNLAKMADMLNHLLRVLYLALEWFWFWLWYAKALTRKQLSCVCELVGQASAFHVFLMTVCGADMKEKCRDFFFAYTLAKDDDVYT